MIALVFAASVAFAQDCSVPAALDDVREHGSPAGYRCIIEADDAGTSVLTALLQYPGDPRLSRALAMWMLQRADTPFDPSYVEKLSPADKRLLADGVRARRGRPSPVPEHDAVFKQFAWYKPVPTYTDARLKPGDREQIALLDKARPISTIGEATAPVAPPSLGDRVRGWFTQDVTEKGIPAVLVLAGAVGAAWYLRRPKA
jgi:hypothetical protein